MAGIVISPTPMELGLYREQYDDLARDLEEAGHRVEVEEPSEWRSTRFQDLVEVYVALRVSHLGDVAVDEVVAAVKRRLRGRKERRPRFVIYGPDGETLREFDLPDEP